jgi:hypothetical protein
MDHKMKELKEHLSQEGIEFIQLTPEEGERIKAITP